ncbi:50S ribosomal protein L25/general stress protein Ctc [Cellulomonas sp. zg-ZUI222]|uniref:Large ribosomal subunit protein bL25 n=1 Tax=Cellulomonas wangleii TaxID=2816956 RepID=A0ABX8D6W5_9CELL|nr:MULTISPECIES: 50S ribosomal protein L25/general stress protein Ctc [Cellulomonas]MBO0901087.1 50S ribosomal protein L25/general stress protein Ctc [Cellulomonas sp. zg-ZUI22]MBO0922600.1 50S ribosomal protein L25/general stress protein Ctc [Cellulomonas wangleii]MBO0926694.1 50S ribosomal protein L25/general stress protein Ctc [Cellulomonas wangleii]QVI63187.1 50S ribosomal protein L25/general stress protein Ctc [Cellulomonas wangleii]
MSEIKLAATPRTEFGKGAARRLRRANQVPAVLYGHGTQPMHVALPGHDTMLALKHSNALYSIELDGKTTLAIVKDVQRDVVRQVIEHVDLLIVKKGEKVAVDVPVHVVGESAPGTIHVVETQNLSLEAEATHLPQGIEVSIEGLADGATVTAGDVVLPEGATLVTDPEITVVTISTPQASAADVAADAAVADLAAQQSAASAADNEG